MPGDELGVINNEADGIVTGMFIILPCSPITAENFCWDDYYFFF